MQTQTDYNTQTTTGTSIAPAAMGGALVGTAILANIIGFGVSILAARIGAGWALKSHDRKR